MHDIAPVLVFFALVIGCVLIARMSIENGKAKREADAQLQLHTRLIDKFGSPKELLDYLQSEAGKKFLTPATVQRSTPYKRILAATQTGIVLTFVAAALWPIRGTLVGTEVRTVTFLASLSFGLGLGFLFAALAAFLLSRKWGLLNGNGGADKGH